MEKIASGGYQRAAAYKLRAKKQVGDVSILMIPSIKQTYREKRKGVNIASKFLLSTQTLQMGYALSTN